MSGILIILALAIGFVVGVGIWIQKRRGSSPDVERSEMRPERAARPPDEPVRRPDEPQTRPPDEPPARPPEG